MLVQYRVMAVIFTHSSSLMLAIHSSSHIPTTDMFNERLSLVVFATWHERSASNSTLHCSVCHRLSVNGKRHMGQRNHQCSFNYQGKTCGCFSTTCLHLGSSDFECRVSNIQYLEWGGASAHKLREHHHDDQANI